MSNPVPRWHRPHPRGAEAEWQAIASAPFDAEAIVHEYQAAYVHAAADGAAAIHVERRRHDARDAALLALSQIESHLRVGVGRIGEVLAEEVHIRKWVAEDSERDSWEMDEQLERHPTPARWPPIRARLEDVHETEAFVATVQQIAREFSAVGDDDGFAILTYQVPAYLTHRRRWPPGRVASVEAAIGAEERRYEGDPPEALLRKLSDLERAAFDATREAREAVS